MNLEKGIAYEVIKGNTDGSIEKGDLIWLSSNYDLCSVKGQGWLSEEEWHLPTVNDFKVKKAQTIMLIIGMEKKAFALLRERK